MIIFHRYCETGVNVDARRRQKEEGRAEGNMEEGNRQREGGGWQKTQGNGFHWSRRYVPHRIYRDNDDNCETVVDPAGSYMMFRNVLLRTIEKRLEEERPYDTVRR